jgi:hypothetical protein
LLCADKAELKEALTKLGFTHLGDAAVLLEDLSKKLNPSIYFCKLNHTTSNLFAWALVLIAN